MMKKLFILVVTFFLCMNINGYAMNVNIDSVIKNNLKEEFGSKFDKINFNEISQADTLYGFSALTTKEDGVVVKVNYFNVDGQPVKVTFDPIYSRYMSKKYDILKQNDLEVNKFLKSVYIDQYKLTDQFFNTDSTPFTRFRIHWGDVRLNPENFSEYIGQKPAKIGYYVRVSFTLKNYIYNRYYYVDLYNNLTYVEQVNKSKWK